VAKPTAVRRGRRDDRLVDPGGLEVAGVELAEQALHAAVAERLTARVAAFDEPIGVPDEEVTRYERPDGDPGDQRIPRPERIPARDQRR
jgi:hypothetical protein